MWGVPSRPTPLTAFVPHRLVELIPHKRIITVRAICSLSLRDRLAARTNLNYINVLYKNKLYEKHIADGSAEYGKEHIVFPFMQDGNEDYGYNFGYAAAARKQADIS